jgi:tetratricopeptide (TPR) repeat protein
VTSRNINIERELARIATGTLRAGELLENSHRIMAVAQGSAWSQAAAYHSRALLAMGRTAEGFATLEEAWQRADRLDDPVAGALASQVGAGCNLMLYDAAVAEEWCRRELDRRRSRLIPGSRYLLTDLLASALVSLGDLPGAREVLAEWEGAAANHVLLVYCQGDWDRAVVLLRNEIDQARGAGQYLALNNCSSVLGRIARVANQHAQAQEILEESLRVSIASQDLNRELFIGIELALVNVDLGRVDAAKEHLHRCGEILASGEDWRGHRGAYAHTSALVQAAERIRKVKNCDAIWRVATHRYGALRLPDDLADGFRESIRIYRHYHAPWEECAALLYWSRAFYAAAPHRRSTEKFNEAFAIFEGIATPLWCERMQAEIFRFLTEDAHLVAATAGEAHSSDVFRREGDYWTICFHGSMCRLRDTIGMHYIGRLLANPGMDFPAQDLVVVAQKSIDRRNRTGKVDLSRTNGRLHHENDEGAYRERARLMVTKRIKDVIGRIRDANPELARHLATCIRTGYTCSYIPEEDHPGNWLT